MSQKAGSLSERRTLFHAFFYLRVANSCFLSHSSVSSNQYEILNGTSIALLFLKLITEITK